MKILFICHRFPFPPNRGGKIRPFQMIRHLSENHAVTVGSLAHSNAEMEEGSGLRDHCVDIIAEVLPSPLRWSRAALSLFSTYPSSAAYFWSTRLERRLQAAASKENFDLIMVHCAFMARYAFPLSGALRILDFGDIDSGKWSDYSHFRGFPLSAGYALEAQKLRRFEREAARQFDRCTLTTNGELEEFKTLGVPAPCTVIPNGVDAGYFQELPADRHVSPVIVFLGRMDYFPNVEGISWFVEHVFPNIRRAVPEAMLRIVGSNPVPRVREFARLEGISVTGFVKDVRPYMADAALAIAPLRIARGTQNKILECMAMGLPVVASPQAAGGIHATPGKHLLVSAETGEFANQVVELLRDEKFRADLSSAGRAQVTQAHRWSQSMNILDQLLENCTRQPAESALLSR
jgi:polysaccharide biosynthesis protein PslH